MYKNQKGFVSIITAATIMIILALITIGFTQIVQREQRQSLDRQLSRQALYAAESGINQTYNALAQNLLADDEQLNDCDPTLSGQLDPVVDAENQVEYTCIQYDKNPTRLDYIVSPTDSKILELQTFSGDPFTEINIEWGNSDTNRNSVSDLPNCSSARDFEPNRADTIPVIKVDLTNMANLNRSALLGNSAYMYLSPCRNGGSGSVTQYDFRDAINDDNVVLVNCNGGTGTTPCSLTVNINTGTDNSASFLARFRPIYTSANVVIRGKLAPATPGPDDVEFAGQYSIDVTARAADIVRRLRAAIPLTSVEDKPEAVFQAFQGACKLLDVDTSNNTVFDNC